MALFYTELIYEGQRLVAIGPDVSIRSMYREIEPGTFAMYMHVKWPAWAKFVDNSELILVEEGKVDSAQAAREKFGRFIVSRKDHFEPFGVAELYSCVV